MFWLAKGVPNFDDFSRFSLIGVDCKFDFVLHAAVIIYIFHYSWNAHYTWVWNVIQSNLIILARTKKKEIKNKDKNK